jgi:pimeloyl-ACP methyl ester carboxylesterase
MHVKVFSGMLRVVRQTVIVNSCPIAYECVGEGEPIVFVHGLSGSTLWWKRNIPALALHYRLYLVDLPGFGSMRRQRRHFRLIEAAEWLYAWIEAIGLNSFYLVGHSMGGYICMDLAVRHPEKVKRLILVSPISVSRETSVIRFIPHILRSGWRITPMFWPILLYDGLRAGVPTLWRTAGQIVKLDAAPVIHALKIPTLLIWGENDDVVPLSLGQQLGTHLTHIQARLLVIQQANHVCMFEQPDQFNAALLTFLAEEG